MNKNRLAIACLTILATSVAAYFITAGIRPNGVDGSVYAALHPSSGGLRGDVQLELPVAAEVLGLPKAASVEMVSEVVTERLKAAAGKNMDATAEAYYVLNADRALSSDLVKARLQLVDKVLCFKAATDPRVTHCAGFDWVSPFQLLQHS